MIDKIVDWFNEPMFSDKTKESPVEEVLETPTDVVVKEDVKKIAQELNSTQKTDEEIVQEIHNEFDTAPDRLYQKAKDILSDLDIPSESKIEEKSIRLQKLGFVKTPITEQARVLKLRRESLVALEIKTKEQAEIILDYKRRYPLQKFLTIDELDRICDKYGLIYAPVNNYIKSVPDKNLTEIENAKPLEKKDQLKIKAFIHVTKYWSDVPFEVKKIMDKGFDVSEWYYDNFISKNRPYNGSEVPSDSYLWNYLNKFGYNGPRNQYIYSEANLEIEDKSMLFIAAPPSHFDLKDLKRTGKGFFKVETYEVKDPIVFRYCRGGIQILSKWGS